MSPSATSINVLRALSHPRRHSWVQVRRHFQEDEFPSSHHREEGWPSDQENIAQHPLSRGRGGVPIDGTRNTTPAASIRRLRVIFLVTSPPLLAVMRGGEYRSFQNDTSQPHIAVSAALDRPLNDFCKHNFGQIKA